ncbi:FAD:protein FMN transferase [Candidatus Amarobacter glycogenicus]|uniref:FAD:protein FMN transferase n=1 Tax=Candidatus Amarobacter glycogenicus TaxID=3140699 RepID=UPI003135BEC2|nr:FAD:protein FMN transferase [Dehalococcoidia bacterium]
MESHESFRAMDTDIDLFIETAGAPPPGAFIGVRLLFEQQEERFSRFREQSLLSRLNRGEVIEDAWLARVVAMAIDAHQLTGGYFNPMVLPALAKAGYDRTFKEIDAEGPLEPQRVPDPAKVIRVSGLSVELLAGQMDLGGIVKGWTADLAAEHLATDHRNAFVNAGGDIRCLGDDATGTGWAMDVSAPAGSTGWNGRLTGAIATSTTLKRRWKVRGGGEAHHLIDPGTGMPSDSPFVQVSVRAETCWLAEVWAKAVLIGGPSVMERAARAGLAVLAYGRNGARPVSEGW